MFEQAKKRLDDEMKSKWIPVAERLPKPFVPVLVCRKTNEGPVVEQGSLTVNGWWKVYGTRTKSVTHWMPLPDPPEKEPK